MEYKTIKYHQGVQEYGSEEIYLSIIKKFIEMTFQKQLNELYIGMQLVDQKRIERACFVLKGSVGQLLAFDYLAKTNALYEIVKKSSPLRDQDIIDLYHRYFDIIDESLVLAQELEVATKTHLDMDKINEYSNAQVVIIISEESIWPIYIQFMQKYIELYSKPSQDNQKCQQCQHCQLF